MIGRRFGQLVVVEQYAQDRQGNRRWLCLCDCGNTTVVRGYTLRVGDVRSCGCTRPPHTPKPVGPGALLYGYKRTESGIEIDEPAAQHIRQIDTFARQGMSYGAIVQQMNAESPRQDGRPWSGDMVERILGNRHLYRGGRRGKLVETWPQILDSDSA